MMELLIYNVMLTLVIMLKVRAAESYIIVMNHSKKAITGQLLAQTVLYNFNGCT